MFMFFIFMYTLGFLVIPCQRNSHSNWVLLIFVQAYFNFKVEYTCTTSVIPPHILFQWPRNRLILVLNILAQYFNYMDIYLN